MTEAPIQIQEFDIGRSQKEISGLIRSFDSEADAPVARRRILPRIVELKRRANQKLQEDLETDDQRRLADFLTDLEESNQPVAERRIVEYDIKRAQDSQYMQETGGQATEIPATSEALLENLIVSLTEKIHAVYPNNQEQAEKLATVRNTLKSIQNHLQMHLDHDAIRFLEIDYQSLLTHRSIFPNQSDYYKVKIRLEREIQGRLVQQFTQNGRTNNKNLAQQLYNRAKKWGVNVNFGVDGVQVQYNDGYGAYAEGLKERQQEKFRQQQQEEREKYGSVSTLYLSPGEQDLLYSENPIDFIEHLIREYEEVILAHKSTAGAAIKQRFGTFISHINTTEFEDRWKKYSELYRQTADGKKKDTLKEFSRQAQRMWRTRTGLQNLRMAIDEANYKEIIPASADVGSGGWFSSLTDENQTYIAFHRLEQKIEEMRLVADPNNPTNVVKQRFTSDEVGQLEKKVLDELIEQKELYGFESDEDVAAAVRTAMNLFITSQRIAHHVAKAGAPVEDPTRKRHPYSFDAYDEFAKTFNVLDFHVDKWFTLTENQQIVLANMLKLIGGNDIELGRRRFSDMLQVYDVFSSGWRVQTMLEQLEAVAKVEYGDNWEDVYNSIALGVKLKAAAKKHRWGEVGGIKDTKYKTAKEVKREYRQKLMDAWEDIARYRPQEILKVFADHVRYKRKENKKTGMWVYDLDRNGKKQLDPKYSNIAGEAIAHLGLHGEDDNGNVVPIQNFAQLQKYIGKYFNPINELLAGYVVEAPDPRNPGEMKKVRGLAAINYSKGFDQLNDSQKQIVRKVFKRLSPGDAEHSMRRYFDQMKKLTEFGLSKDGARIRAKRAKKTDRGYLKVIDELIYNPFYETIYTRVQFLDDARYWMAQAVPKDRNGENLVTPIAERFSLLQGSGMKDMLPRAWGDMSAASQALQNLQKGMSTLKQEDLLKAAEEMWNQIKQVEGISEASAAVAYLIGGWLNAAKTDSFLAWTGLHNLPIKSSEFQRKLGRSAPSMTIDEREHISHWIDSIAGNLEDLVHDEDIVKRFEEASHTKEQQLYLFRIRIFIIIMLIFLLQEMLKETEKIDK